MTELRLRAGTTWPDAATANIASEAIANYQQINDFKQPLHYTANSLFFLSPPAPQRPEQWQRGKNQDMLNLCSESGLQKIPI